MPTESSNSSVPGNITYIAVRTPPGFNNQGNETRRYFNAKNQIFILQYSFRKRLSNID